MANKAERSRVPRTEARPMAKAKKASRASAKADESVETRQRVLDAAIKEFAEHGYSGARVENIAVIANANKQAIYYYFADKDDLFAHALQRCYELVHEIDDHLLFEGMPANEAIASLVDAVFDRLAQLKDVISVISDENRNKGRHLPGTQIRAINRPTIDAVAALLDRGNKDGTIRKGVDPEQFWLSLLSLVMFYFTNSYTLSHLLDRNLITRDNIAQRKIEVGRLLRLSLRP